nr:winged helix-turn-helix domain-containing protein [Bowmanella yangjiangensis]
MVSTYQFGEFEFDPDQLVLKQHGQIVSLNEKACLLLALLLENRDKILSKDTILDKVWTNRVVTEQVIFQNISLLRSIFGETAIKTFPKKGYQWQSPIIDNRHQPTEVTGQDKNKDLAQVPKPFGGLSRPAVYGLGIAILLIVSVLWYRLYTLSPLAALQPEQIFVLAPAAQEFRVQNLQAGPSAQALFDSPHRTYAQTANAEELLVATKNFPVKSGVVVSFIFQGPQRSWQDYILVKTAEEAQHKLSAAVLALRDGNYFSLSHPQQALSVLQMRQNDLGAEQARLYMALEEYDKAAALVERQLLAPDNNLEKALYLWLKAQIAMENKQFPVARASIEAALTIQEAVEVAPLKAQMLMTLSWSLLVDNDLRQGMQVLNKAVASARAAREPLLELNAHRIQAFMASKAGQTELAFTQMGLATQLISLNQLADEHLVLLLSTQAWMAGPGGAANGFYQQILSRPFTPQYQKDFYIAAKQLRQSYIQQQRWDEALALISPWQRDSFQSLTRASVLLAQQNRAEGIKEALQSFQIAQLAQSKTDALDSALLLLQHAQSGDTMVDTVGLKSYLTAHATRRWRDQNSRALDAAIRLSSSELQPN